jgi:hypothetical protein
VGNALARATGVDFFELPLDPERVYLTLKRVAEGKEPTGTRPAQAPATRVPAAELPGVAGG